MTTIAAPARFRARAAVRGADPAWVRPALLAVLAAAAALCLWHLTASGYSNTYYAAAAKASSVSWKAWFFGSLDPGSFITVDKPPLSLWVQGLSARVFGFSSLALLLPQALFTVASVALLFATVRRLFGPAAGVLAAAALAITPVTIAIGRVNNPDALLVLLCVGAAYLLARALDSGRTKHLVWCAVLIGLAFMTKMLQGWMVVPALATVYLVAGPPRLGTRLWQLTVAGVTMVGVSLAWPLAVSLWPGATPYIGGSTNGSVWDLITGYNGFGRIFGDSGPGGGQGANFGGVPGLWRMFNEQVGGQVAWLLPLAAVGLVAGLWLTRRAPRTDLARAGWLLFGVWALVHFAVFSWQKGIFHPYDVSALAPAVAALAGAGAVTLWRWAQRSWAASRRSTLPCWRRRGSPWRCCTACPTSRRGCGSRFRSRRHSPSSARSRCGWRARSRAGRSPWPRSRERSRSPPDRRPTAWRRRATASTATTSSPGRRAPAGGMGGPGFGGFGGGSTNAEVIAYLQAHQGSAKYLVAATGSMTTAGIIMATGQPVVTIGGFTGSDPAPTVAQLEAMVAKGELRYVLLSGQGGGPGGGNSEISSWVQEHGTAVTGSGTNGGTLYRVSA